MKTAEQIEHNYRYRAIKSLVASPFLVKKLPKSTKKSYLFFLSIC